MASVRIIDPVAIGDEAVVKAVVIQERGRVGAVVREAGHAERQDEPDLTQPDLTNESLKAARRLVTHAPLRPRPASITSRPF